MPNSLKLRFPGTRTRLLAKSLEFDPFSNEFQLLWKPKAGPTPKS